MCDSVQLDRAGAGTARPLSRRLNDKARGRGRPYVFSVVAAENWSAAFTPLPRGLFPVTFRKLPSAAEVRKAKRPEGRAPAPILIGAVNRYGRPRPILEYPDCLIYRK